MALWRYKPTDVIITTVGVGFSTSTESYVLHQIKRIVIKSQIKQFHVATGCILPMLQLQSPRPNQTYRHASSFFHTHSFYLYTVLLVRTQIANEL